MTFSRSFAVTAKLFAAERAFVYVTGRRQGVLDSVVAAIGANAIGIRNDIANFTYFDRKPVAMLVKSGTRSAENRCTLLRITRSSVGAQLCSAAPLKSIDHEMLAGHEHMRLDGQIAHDAGDVLRRTDRPSAIPAVS
jgi:hypothetical protein